MHEKSFQDGLSLDKLHEKENNYPYIIAYAESREKCCKNFHINRRAFDVGMLLLKNSEFFFLSNFRNFTLKITVQWKHSICS